MNIYILQAHNYSYLPYQVYGIRKYLKEAQTIYVAEGPFRDNLYDSKVKIDPCYAKDLGVEIFTIRSCSKENVFGRLTDLMNACLVPSGLKMILQGDTVPVKEMTIEQLMEGKLMSGRAIQYPNGKIYLDYTWLLTEHIKKVSRWYEGDIKDVKWWPSKFQREPIQIEHCEPGFCHLDKISWQIKVDEKLAYIKEVLGVDLPPPVMITSVEKVLIDNAFAMKKLLADDNNLKKLPQEVADKVRGLRGGCGCHYTPWVKDNLTMLNGFLGE